MSCACAILGYIGPGAGFAVSVSFFTAIVVAFSVVLGPILLPAAMAVHRFRRRKVRYRRGFRRVVVVGLDGFDYKLAQKFMAEGRLPHFTSLAKEGHFGKLATVLPAITPAAWPSFMTGTDPSRHGIFDFITRDPFTYLPKLSSSEVIGPRYRLSLGRWTLPISSPRVRMLRKGIPFWHALGRQGLEVTVLRVPITFPPEPFSGRLLSGMCVPDLRGSLGTYSLFTTSDEPTKKLTDAEVQHIQFENGRATATIFAAVHPLHADGRRLQSSMSVNWDGSTQYISLHVGRTHIMLRLGELSRWVQVSFRVGLTSLTGLVRFHLVRLHPHLQLYMSPIHLDPERPAMPLSHPRIFSNFLAKKYGAFATLGLAEDTSALNDGNLDEEGFLAHAWATFDERRSMFLQTLDQKSDDFTICVFDTPDRIQHMFWRYLETGHPAMAVDGNPKYATAIQTMMEKMDELVGEVRKRLLPDTLLVILSDHGFASFRRGVNLNTWLEAHGYLYRRGKISLEATDWLADVDWTRTRAYAIGLTGIFLNLKGRESQGIVSPDDAPALLNKLKVGLEAMEDRGSRVIQRAYVTREFYQGPYRDDGPDLLVGFCDGYRCSWEGARGGVSAEVFKDNTRAWSGDHCVEPQLVPGVLFSNARFTRSEASILDVAPTILDTFGVVPDSPMQGRSLFEPTDVARRFAHGGPLE